MHGNSFQRKLTIVKNGGPPIMDVRLSFYSFRLVELSLLLILNDHYPSPKLYIYMMHHDFLAIDIECILLKSHMIIFRKEPLHVLFAKELSL